MEIDVTMGILVFLVGVIFGFWLGTAVVFIAVYKKLAILEQKYQELFKNKEVKEVNNK